MTRKPLAWPACAKCGSPDRLDKHHVFPRSKGGPDIAGNMAYLCKACHQLWHSLRRSKSLTDEIHAARVFGTWLREIPAARRQRRFFTDLVRREP